MADGLHVGVACLQVNEKLKHVRFGTAAGTRFTIKEKHKDVLTDKAVVKDRAKANVLMSSEYSINLSSCMDPGVFSCMAALRSNCYMSRQICSARTCMRCLADLLLFLLMF